MNKLSNTVLPLNKDLSFGPQSHGGLSVLHSTSTMQNRKETCVVQPTSHSHFAFTTLLGQSVTPRPQNAVTPVTVDCKTIRTPKYNGPQGLGGPLGQDMPSTNHDVDQVSQKSVKSHSQRSAFKPVAKKRGSDQKSMQGGGYHAGVTKSNEKHETAANDAEKPASLAQFGNDATPASNCSNSQMMTVEKQLELQNKINNSGGSGKEVEVQN